MENHLNNNLNEKQRQLLMNAIKKREQRKADAGVSAPSEKKEVTPNEYRKRLQEQMERDAKIIAGSNQERIDKAIEEWENSVGPRFSRAVVENPRVKSLVDGKVQKISEGVYLHRNGLVLSGIVGGGKTWTAYAYARMLIGKGLLAPSSVVHGTEASLLLPLTLGYDRTEKIHEFLNRGKKFYIIDDSGVCNYRTPEQRYEVWFQLVNHAYEHHIPLVITTSMSTVSRDGKPSQLAEWIGEAAYDRLQNIADVVVPSDSNKRSAATKNMDNGKIYGLAQAENNANRATSTNDDPFAGLGSGERHNSQAPKKPRRNVTKSVSDLRPPL